MAQNRANLSEQALAKDLGIISAARNTKRAVTTVVAATAPSPHRRVAVRVAKAALPMCMMLLPINMADRASSKWSRI